MKLICPSCGAVHSIEAWQNDAVARQCLKLAGEMQHAISSRCFAYLALFRPGQKSLTWKKVLRLLSELQDLTAASHIQWDRNVARPNSVQAWAVAMEKIVEFPPKRLPLKTHGYLKSIAYENADDMDRQKEVKRNKSERDGSFTRYIPAKNGEPSSLSHPRSLRHLRESGDPGQPERINFEKMKEITANYRKKRS